MRFIQCMSNFVTPFNYASLLSLAEDNFKSIIMVTLCSLSNMNWWMNRKRLHFLRAVQSIYLGINFSTELISDFKYFWRFQRSFFISIEKERPYLFWSQDRESPIWVLNLSGQSSIQEHHSIKLTIKNTSTHPFH